MKNFFFILLLLAGLSLAAQTNYDEIRLRNGEIIKCKILEINLDTYTIFYSNLKTGGESAVSLNEVGSYVWDGEINKGLPKPGLMKKEKLGIYDNAFYSGDHNLIEAGNELIKFADISHGAIALSIVGNSLLLTSFLFEINDQLDTDKFNRQQRSIRIAGFSIIGAGLIMHIVSYSRARKAGQKLKLSRNIALNTNADGVGLRYSLK